MIRFSLLSCALFLGLSLTLSAVPQFSLLTGNRCVNCHVNSQGGGLRNELGWYSTSDVGLISPKSIGLEGLYGSPESNTLLTDRLIVGMDTRFQLAKSHKSPDADTKFFPMQAALHSAYTATDWLKVEGTYNFGGVRYNGQAFWSASALIQPGLANPQLRIGYFEPSIGMKYDDHTMLVRQIAGTDYVPLIAPNYAEYGAEITYEGLKWLTVNGGVFSAKKLAENTVADKTGNIMSLISNTNTPSFSGRVIFWPHLLENTVTSYIGSSYLANGDFSFLSSFAGIGWTDHLSAMAELAHSSKTGMRTTDNFSMEILYKITDPLLVYVRGERGRTRLEISDGTVSNFMTQVVIGTQIFLIPYVEIRPEYRIVDTEQKLRTLDQYESGRFAMQFHIFY